MKTYWHLLKEKKPPQGVILLVCSAFGLDLAICIADQWYFKKGDDWSLNNLAHWNFTKPTHWAEFPRPMAYDLVHDTGPMDETKDFQLAPGEDCIYSNYTPAPQEATDNLKNYI